MSLIFAMNPRLVATIFFAIIFGLFRLNLRRFSSEFREQSIIRTRACQIEHTEKLQNLCLDEEKPLKLTAGSFYRSKHYHRNHPGEDSHFICPEKNTFGVADGVGSWALKGIDAGAYARLLMRNSATALARELPGRVNPKRVLQEAHANTNVPGSSTACIVALSSCGTLTAANVGDGGFMVFRDGRLVYHSPVQHHGYNTPYQLGTKEYSKDDASVAQEIEVSVHAGDIIVAGTDGMLDNLHAEEIESIISEWTKGGSDCPAELAQRVGVRASGNSKKKFYRSPLQIAAGRWGQGHLGGKVDDITVVVGLVGLQ